MVNRFSMFDLLYSLAQLERDAISVVHDWLIAVAELRTRKKHTPPGQTDYPPAESVLRLFEVTLCGNHTKQHGRKY